MSNDWYIVFYVILCLTTGIATVRIVSQTEYVKRPVFNMFIIALMAPLVRLGITLCMLYATLYYLCTGEAPK